MSKHKNEPVTDTETLAEGARAFLVATSEVAGEKVAEARDRLRSALERSREIYDDVREKAAAGVKAGDKFVRGKPYAALGIALGIGALLGIYLSRRNRE